MRISKSRLIVLNKKIRRWRAANWSESMHFNERGEIWCFIQQKIYENPQREALVRFIESESLTIIH